MEELKPCPFCGGHGILKDRYIHGIANTKHYWVVCGKCEMRIQERRSAVRAIEAWNRRAERMIDEKRRNEAWAEPSIILHISEGFKTTRLEITLAAYFDFREEALQAIGKKIDELLTR